MCFVIDYRSPSRLKYDLFRRLNTGGKPLNGQEIRNCLSKPVVQNALMQMSGSEEFKLATNGTVKDTRLQAQEIALRFLYFRRQYSSADLYYKTRKFILVPKEFYNEDTAEQEFSSIWELKPSERLYMFVSEKFSVVAVYAIPVGVFMHFIKLQPDIKYFPSIRRLFEKAESSSSDSSVYAVWDGSLLEMLAVRDGKLFMCNAYDAKDTASVLYFLLNAIDSAGFKRTDVPVSFFMQNPVGEPSDENKEFKEMLSSYIGKIEFLSL